MDDPMRLTAMSEFQKVFDWLAFLDFNLRGHWRLAAIALHRTALERR
jgi:hypothetical protein